MGKYGYILFALLALSGLAYPACQVISSPGTYTLVSDVSGAPYSLSGVDYISQSCIVIASSNVTFDCNGYSITNNGTADAAGIVVNGSTSINYTNVTIQNCPSISGYRIGAYLYNTSQDTIRNSTSNNNTWYGLYFYSSSHNIITDSTSFNNVYGGFCGAILYNNTIANNTAYNNSNGDGFTLYRSSESNTYINNTAYNNTYSGIYAYSSSNDIHNNLFTNNTVYNNKYGIYIGISDYNTFVHDNAYGNWYSGIYLFASSGVNVTNCTLYNNQYGLYANNSNYTMQYTNFLPESGAFTNYANLSITDTMGAAEAYSVNWSSFSGSMPSNRSSFAQKYVNITTQAGTPSIDEITFHWLSSELSGYTETYFELWKFNTSTGWTLLNNASDTTNNELKLYDLNPSSIYGILQSNESDCRVISYPGTYTLLNNVSGANPISGVQYINQACIVIASPNVTFDCNGYSITNNGTADAAGIVVNGSTALNYTNVTIQNCPGVSQYEIGIYLYNTSQDIVRNSTASNNTIYGVNLYESGYNNVTNNTLYDNTWYGIILWPASSYNLLADNVARDNTAGICLYSGSNYNTFSNNTAYANSEHGFYTYTSSANTFSNNTAYSNLLHGFFFFSASSNNLSGNRASGNSQYGIYLRSTTQTTIANCTLYSNHYGLYANDSNYTMEGTSFLPASGEFINYANLSITDNMSASEEYTVNWSSSASSPPAGYLSFAQKYINITTQAGTPSIDEITFHWLTSELSASGYIESYFELWKFNTSTGWTVLNETPDIANNYLKLYALNPSSIYGILQLAVESEGGDTGGGGGTECNTDSDCAECYYCSTANGKCAVLSTAECTADEGCAAGYNCTGCRCVQAGCIYDSDCPIGEYCAAPNCLTPECGCGYIENHECIAYECCVDSECPAGYSCKDNSCVQAPAQELGSEEGEDGGDGGDGGSGNGGTAGNLTTGQEEPQVNATEPSQSQHEAEVPSAEGGEEGAGAMGGSSEPLDLAGAGGIVLILLIVAGIVYFFYTRKG